MTIQTLKDNISAMLHGGYLDKVRSFDLLAERAMNTMLSKIDPVDTIRTVALSTNVWDDIYKYTLPSDFKKPIDLFPQADRGSMDNATRIVASRFDLQKAIANKEISIEGEGGDKIIKINWRTRSPKTLHGMDSLTANGTWAVVGTASGLELDTITKFSGAGSIRFDSAASGDGIQITDMSDIDLDDEDEVGDVFVRFYIKNSTDLGNLTSISAIWGNDLTANLWTGVAQTTQADGTALKVGWNTVKIPWSTATETGTVDPEEIDALKITFATTDAISDIRIDKITCAIGKAFDIKYYSKYIMQNSSGTWIERTTADDDVLVLDKDAEQIYILECFIAAAHQIEGADSTFDINFAKQELETLYRKYRAENPSLSKKVIGRWTGSVSRGRW